MVTSLRQQNSRRHTVGCDLNTRSFELCRVPCVRMDKGSIDRCRSFTHKDNGNRRAGRTTCDFKCAKAHSSMMRGVKRLSELCWKRRIYWHLVASATMMIRSRALCVCACQISVRPTQCDSRCARAPLALQVPRTAHTLPARATFELRSSLADINSPIRDATHAHAPPRGPRHYSTIYDRQSRRPRANASRRSSQKISHCVCEACLRASRSRVRAA